MNLPPHSCWATAQTPLGWIGLAAGPQGISRIALPAPSEALTLERLGRDNGELVCRDQEALNPWLGTLGRALAGEPTDFSDWPLDWSAGSPFQRRVWQATRQIPWGQTRSYGWVAVRAGEPRAARAVGLALGANPLPLVVPCHRVVRTGGGLGGFGGGLDLKRRLLEIEGAAIAEAPAPR
jgi:methylated-DNA-[protein]-cysteine S-methyltransferase